MKLGQVDVGSTAKTTFREFREDDLQGLAAQVAYNFLFAVVPLLIFLTALSGFVSRAVGVNDAMSSITDWLFANLPVATAAAVKEPIENVIKNQSGGFLSLGALLALWGGKNAIAAMMKALNVAFDVEETRPWWKKNMIAIGLTIALGLAVVAASSFFLAGSFVGDELASKIGLGSTWTIIWSFLRWPLIALVIIVAVAFFYHVGPNVTAPFRWLTPGSVVAVVFWGIATLGLSFYFRYFGGYAEAYGALGGVLAFVFWMYVMSLILLLGGELNAVLARTQDAGTRDQVADPAKHPSDGGSGRKSFGAPDAERPDGMMPVGTASVLLSSLRGSTSWPSSERDARVRLVGETPVEQGRRGRRALSALAVSAAAAVSAALVGLGRRHHP
jgi:membrane protein